MIRNIVRSYFAKPGNIVLLRNKSSVTNINEKPVDDISLDEENEVLEEEDQIREAEIEKKRNKSRLNVQHRNMIHENIPYPEPVAEFQKTVKYQRKLYGVYGNASGVYPGICWPTKQEIEDNQEYERVAFPYSIQEMMQQSAEKKKLIEETQQKRQDEIVKKIVKLEQWKKEVRDRIAKKETDAKAARDRKDKLVEEVRRHFGFKIDPKDERFKQMLEQKEKAEKKALKEAKRKVKEAKLIAKLQDIKVEPSSITNVEKTNENKID